MITNEELDTFIEGELKKDIDQSDKIDDSVNEHLGQMGFLWERVNAKLQADKICFKCKKIVDFKVTPIHVLEASPSDKGVIAFCSICEECHRELEENFLKQTEKEDKNGK